MSSPFKVTSYNNSIEFHWLFFGNAVHKRYAFGINEYSAHLSKLVNLDGFIDDYTDKKTWSGKPVHKLSSIEPGSLVVSCVTANRPVTALRNLQEAGIRQYCDYFSLANASGERLPQVQAVIDTRNDHREHAEQYQWLRHQLWDGESRNVFDRIMEFRLTGNLSSMANFEYAADRQYFEPFVELCEGEVFVDGGGYDGFTSAEFAVRCPEYAAIHFFEPSQKMLAKAKVKLAELHCTNYHPVGLYDRATSLSFDSSAGSASRIVENGSDTIEVARLDDVVSEPVSFIKLDLEGAELLALRGGESHILRDHPKIAVAVYHHPSDFWRIPQYILSLRGDYRLYLRHYTEGWTETVMFFIPCLDSE